MGLGFFFVILQGMEYYAAAYNFSDGIYAATFYSLTGLHGFHVIVGTLFILMCFFRLLRQHYLRNHYLGFVFSI
jgi:cytochrome c oxidase subunit III